MDWTPTSTWEQHEANEAEKVELFRDICLRRLAFDLAAAAQRESLVELDEAEDMLAAALALVEKARAEFDRRNADVIRISKKIAPDDDAWEYVLQ